MGDNKPVSLAARRKEKQQAKRKAALQRWVPSRSVLAWPALVGVAAVTFLAFGRWLTFNQADMSAAMQPGGIGECVGFGEPASLMEIPVGRTA